MISMVDYIGKVNVLIIFKTSIKAKCSLSFKKLQKCSIQTQLIQNIMIQTFNFFSGSTHNISNEVQRLFSVSMN